MSQIDSLVTAARRTKRRKPPEPAVSAAARPTVYGPYADGGKWRLIVTDGDERKASKTDTYKRAVELRDSMLEEINRRTSRTFREAVTEYRDSLTSRGVLTIEHIIGQLRRFLPMDEVLSSIDRARAEAMYAAEALRKSCSASARLPMCWRAVRSAPT